MTTTPAQTAIDPARVAALTERSRAELAERTRRSGEYFERASGVMPGGVPSQFQKSDPWPVYIERGEGARVWDVDGNEYLDFHNGFGVMCVGHANPIIAAAVKARMDDGTHFAAPTEGSIVVAEELRRRWGLPRWRFTNSGTESTMDADPPRARRDGQRHHRQDRGHLPRPPRRRDGLGQAAGRPDGRPRAPQRRPLRPRLPVDDGVADPARPVQRRRRARARSSTELDGQVAGVILEPAMMNINIVPPVPGYLERVRELATAHGVVLIFDEVKTGAAVAAGGATELFGVTPDVVCLAKAICGGLPGGAVGMTEALGELVADGRVRQQGTFNGNPLVMAAAQATLLDVLTPGRLRAAAQGQHRPDGRLRPRDRGVRPAGAHGRHGLEGLRGDERPSRSASTATTSRRSTTTLTELAWLYHMNHGIFMTPGADEEWTLSVLHSDADLQRYVDVFEMFARDVTSAA